MSSLDNETNAVIGDFRLRKHSCILFQESFCYSRSFRLSLVSATRFQSTATKPRNLQGWKFGSILFQK